MSRTASRAKTVYACAECGQTSPKWLGQCPACKQWNTMQEEVVAPEPARGAPARGWGVAAAARPIPLREVEARFMALTKTTETPVFLVGHVTKDGAIAGPRVLEHMVDTVLYFEGGGAHPYRVLRAHKNRFGSASEIGVFEMKSGGLAEVPNPSALFLAERPEDAPGSAVAAILNGTRTVLVKVQALVAPTGYGTPRRTALGIDSNRVALLAAVLEKKVGLELVGCDLFVNVAGGLSVDDPAADLATVAALASSFRDKAIPARTLLLGEVGLAGEVRA